MSLRLTLSSLAFCFLTVTASPAFASDPGQVLLSRDGVSVTRADLDRYIASRIPEEQRTGALSRPGAVREMLAQLYIIRTLAAESQDMQSLDEEAIRWQAELQENRIRMEALLQKRIADEAAGTDWTALAREHYVANRENFESPERASAAHILIRTEGRSEDEARELAEQIAGRAREGEDFAALATEYSEDPSAEQNQGDLGFFQRGQMVPEFEQAVFAMDTEGEIAGPLKSQFGFHVIRYQGRRDARVRSFDEVRESIVRDLRQRQANEVREAEVARVRAAEGIVVDHEAVDALEAEHRAATPENVRERRQQSGRR